MENKDNRIFYAIVGSIPFVGAYMGTRYAQTQKELYQLDPLTPHEWDHPLLNAFLGATTVGGVLFGWGRGQQDLKIAALKAGYASKTKEQSLPFSKTSDDVGVEKTKMLWQNKISQLTEIKGRSI